MNEPNTPRILVCNKNEYITQLNVQILSRIVKFKYVSIFDIVFNRVNLKIKNLS